MRGPRSSCALHTAPTDSPIQSKARSMQSFSRFLLLSRALPGGSNTGKAYLILSHL